MIANPGALLASREAAPRRPREASRLAAAPLAANGSESCRHL